MRTHRPLRLAALFAAGLLLASAAHAQLFRAYVAPTGVDTNPCTLPLPCRLLPAALAAVASGGEIWMLDSANYNATTVAITKSVSILAVPGAVGSIVANNADAIAIATPGVRVSLRNVVIAPIAGTTGNGVTLSAGDALTVENSVIAGLAGTGVSVSGAATLRMSDTAVRDNTVDGLALDAGARAVVTRCSFVGNGARGIVALASTAATTTLSVGDSTLAANGTNGLLAFPGAGTTKVTVRSSRVTLNGADGLLAVATGGSAVLAVSDSEISHNQGSGVGLSGATARGWASRNVVADNTGAGFAATTGSVMETMGDNALRGNASTTSGTLSLVTPFF